MDERDQIHWDAQCCEFKAGPAPVLPPDNDPPLGQLVLCLVVGGVLFAHGGLYGMGLALVVFYFGAKKI